MLCLGLPSELDTIAAIPAAPYLPALDERALGGVLPEERANLLQCATDGYAILVCEDEDEQASLYAQTVGDDGPTAANPHAGPGKVYAFTIDALGRIVNENT